MYRYPRQSRFNSVMKTNRWRPILILVVLVALILLIVKLFSGGGLNEENFEAQRNAKLRSEMRLAVTQTNSLSRLGGSSSSLVLGRIRAYVHGMEAINDLNVSIYGEIGRLYRQEEFDIIYSTIDEYDAKLQSGQRINDVQSVLTDLVNALSDKTAQLIGA